MLIINLLALILISSPQVSADVGIYELCLYNEPDGAAFIEPAPGQPEIMILFKGDQVWLHSIFNFVGRILEPNQPGSQLLYTRTNGLNAPEIFPQFPTGYKRVVSFSGLNPTHPFYNNILVFHHQEVLRYRVTEISLENDPTKPNNGTGRAHDIQEEAKSGNLKVKLESVDSLEYWPGLSGDLGDVKAIYIIRGTRLLVMLLGRFRSRAMFVLNKANLGAPIISNDIVRLARNPFGNKMLFRHTMADGKELAFVKNGGVCFQPDKCVPLETFVGCEPLIAKFRRGFAYWLHHNTEMTFRLISLGLVAAHLMSMTIGVVYIYSQAKRFLMLT